MSSLGFQVQVLVPACPEPSGVEPSPGLAKAVATLPSRWLGFVGSPPAQRPSDFCLHYRGKGRARNRKETGQGMPAREGWAGGPPWPAHPCRNGDPSGLGALHPDTANTRGEAGGGGTLLPQALENRGGGEEGKYPLAAPLVPLTSIPPMNESGC